MNRERASRSGGIEPMAAPPSSSRAALATPGPRRAIPPDAALSPPPRVTLFPFADRHGARR